MVTTTVVVWLLFGIINQMVETRYVKKTEDNVRKVLARHSADFHSAQCVRNAQDLAVEWEIQYTINQGHTLDPCSNPSVPFHSSKTYSKSLHL